MKNYDNNLKKFSRIIDDYYSPLNYIAPELQLDSPNVSSSSNSHDSSSPLTIAASFVADLKQTCSSSSYVDQHIYAQTLAYLSDLSNPNNNKNDDLTDNRLVTDLDSLRSLLNMSLAIAGTSSPNMTTSIDNNNNNNNPRQKCLRVLLDALYFIFSQQYSKLFKAVGFRFDSNARLVNETILDLIENARSKQPNETVMLMPALRDMRVFFDKYRRSISSGGKNSELRFCDPLPPYLCN